MRVLIVGGGIDTGGTGARGLTLARALVAEGHAVRFAADEAHRATIEDAGCECWVGTADRIGTLRYALENATVLLWLFADLELPEIHGSRLEMMLERTIDTTVRGVLYEAGGRFDESGSEIVTRMASKNEIPYTLLQCPIDEQDRWLREALDGINEIVSVDRSSLKAAWDL